MHIHGTNRHQEYPWLGDAIPKWIHDSDLKDIRFNLNHNFIRTCHYTQDKYVYDWCDSNGLIVAEEVPNIKDIDFSEDVQEQHVREMIRRDRNHPSILFWSLGNETNDAADSRWVREEDTTRMIHARHVKGNSAGDFVMHTDEDMDMENLLRCTIRGWYNADVKNLEPENNQWTGNEEFQHKMAMKSGGSQRGIISMGNGVMWIYADHGADREYVNSPLKHINPKGWVDLYRQPKYLYYLWQANYHDRPMVFIHPHFWREQYKGQKKDFIVDSNCDRVELKVNGRSVGILSPKAEAFNTVTFTGVPVEGGILEAIATRGDTSVRHTLNMAGKPAKIVLSSSHNSLEADLASVAVIKADVTDAEGNHVYGANPELTWKIEGPATLVGPSVWVTDIDKHEAEEGTFYIDLPVCNVIRSTGTAGVAKVKVLADGIEAGEVVISFVKKTEAKSVVFEPAIATGNRKVPVKDKSSAIKEGGIPGQLRDTRYDMVLALTHRLTQPRNEVMLKIIHENPEADTASSSVQLLADVFVKHLQNNDGLLVADDYNFIVSKFNTAAKAAILVESLSLPVLFKKELVRYYYQVIVAEGRNITPEDVRKKFMEIPTVMKMVVTGDYRIDSESGVLRSSGNDVSEIVQEVFPGNKLKAIEMQRYLNRVAQLNPWIEVIARSESNGEKIISFFIGKGKLILLPGI